MTINIEPLLKPSLVVATPARWISPAGGTRTARTAALGRLCHCLEGREMKLEPARFEVDEAPCFEMASLSASLAVA